MPKGEKNSGSEIEGGSTLAREYERYSPEQKRDTTRESQPKLTQKEIECFRTVLSILLENKIPFAVGAAFARYEYTGIWRRTKDLDVFIRPRDLKHALIALDDGGLQTEIASEHWLAKAHCGKYFVDLIFGTGHGQLPIDDDFFWHVRDGDLFGLQVPFVSPEEMIASAAYIATRHRFDGAEILHLILKTKGNLDWDRIIRRLGENRELLLWHLILFDFVYPGHSDYLPKELMIRLFKEVRENLKSKPKNPKYFRGTLIDPFSFTVDVEDWGYEDIRKLTPLVDAEGESL